jgi:hypothetical protein
MRNKVIWSFLSLVALATGGLVAGCDSDAKITKSAEGDSCTKTSDCNDGLRCEQGTCYKATGHIDNSAGAPSGAGDQPGVVGPKPPVLGGPGESCTKRADCEDRLSCLSQRCTADVGGGDGGAGPGPGPMLGGLGETCVLTSDCSKGFACLPGAFRGEGSGVGVGTCTSIDSGLKPTGKVCGAECVEAADCCELPIEQQGLTGAASCSDLAALVKAIPDCDTAIETDGLICLAYNAYCDGQCTSKTWTCDAGLCNYAVKCTKATEVAGGCPTFSRGGRGLLSCDVKSGKCEGTPAVVVGCTSDAKCDAGLAVADSLTDDVCSKGECACHVETGGCYRKCDEAIDCRLGYTCNDKTSLCEPITGCTTDAQCITNVRDYRVKCVDGVCTQPPCEHDIDCNPNGLVNGAFEAVCGPDKTCALLGCSSNDECVSVPVVGIPGTTVHSFCAPRPAPTATTALPVSATTD